MSRSSSARSSGGSGPKRPRATSRLGVDEKAIAEGHHSVTLVCALDRAAVEVWERTHNSGLRSGPYPNWTDSVTLGRRAIQLLGRTRMSVNVMPTLRKAVRELEAEKARIDRQLTAIRGLLGGLDNAKSRAAGVVRQIRTRQRRRMSPAARRAVSHRMKMYWAKRKAAAAKKHGAARRK